MLMTLQTSINPPQLPPAISHRHIGKGTSVRWAVYSPQSFRSLLPIGSNQPSPTSLFVTRLAMPFRYAKKLPPLSKTSPWESKRHQTSPTSQTSQNFTSTIPTQHLSFQPGFKFSVDYSHLQSLSPACSSYLIYVSFIFHLFLVFSSFFFVFFIYNF